MTFWKEFYASPPAKRSMSHINPEKRADLRTINNLAAAMTADAENAPPQLARSLPWPRNNEPTTTPHPALEPLRPGAKYIHLHPSTLASKPAVD